MAWTASVVNVVKSASGGTAAVTINFTNGSETYEQTFNVSDPASLNQIVTDQLRQYGAIDSFTANPPTGPVAPVSPITPPAPSAADVARQTFLADLEMLRHMNNAVAFGLITQQFGPYQALVAKIKAEFIPDYLPLV